MTGWKKVQLGDMIEPVERWNPVRADQNKLITYIDLSAVDQVAKQVGNPLKLPCSEAPSRARQIVAEGDVLVSTVRPNLNGVALIPPELDGATASTGFSVLRARPALLHPSYLFHWVKTADFIGDMVNKATGASYPAVSDRIVSESLIPLPPLPEQQRIAEILDRAEALRAKRRAAFEQLDGLTQAIFRDMFGDHTEILSKWSCAKLGSVLDFMTSGSRGWAAHYAESGDLFLRIQNVGHDELVLADVAYVNAPETAEAKRTRVQPADVLLSITADLGRTAVVPEAIGPAFINQHLSILRTTSLASRFLSAYLASPAGQHQIYGRNRQCVKAGLNFDDIRSFITPTPPRELQSEFSYRADAVDSLKAIHRASLAIMDEFFASLQHRAFRGEL
jgi:type I restriction enzyme, S subunit